MFTTMYRQLVLERDAVEGCSTRVPSETAEITRRNIVMIFSRLNRSNESAVVADRSDSIQKLLSVLDKDLDRLIDTDDVLNRISGRRCDKSERIERLFIKKIKGNRGGRTAVSQSNSFRCPFEWDLETPPNKDIITRIKRKYGDYNLDISSPATFTFEKYVLNIVIAYELFRKGEEEKAKITVLHIGKWLEELDDSDDEFYFSMSDGLKHVLIGTFLLMKPTKHITNQNVQELLHNAVHFFDMNQQSKAAVLAIQAAVLIEYGYNDDNFRTAVKCTKEACDLNPENAFWFYRHALALMAHRHFLLTFKSSPNENETNAIQQAIELSNIQNANIMYHAMILFKDRVFYNFHSNKNNTRKVVTTPCSNQHLCDAKKLVQMIRQFVGMEPEDPLTVVNCARILMNFPEIAQDQNLGTELLTKGLQMASNDLIVLKNIVRVIIVNEKKVIMNSSCKQYQDQLLQAKNQINLCDDLKFAVEKHKNGEDPLPHLLGVMTNYEYQFQWKILAQICSYTILYCKGIQLGVEYFMMLVEAEQNGLINSDLILRHYSSFVYRPNNFNLAELMINEIMLALADNTLQNTQHYYIVLAKIMYTYEMEVKNPDKSMRSKIVGESRTNGKGLQQFNFKNNVNQTVAKNINTEMENCSTNQHSNTHKKHRSRSGPKNSRNPRNGSISQVNLDTDENDSNDDISTNINGNNNECCSCRIM